MKISDSTKRHARNLCRIASVLTVLVSMNACGAIRDALDGKDGSGTNQGGGSASNGNDTGNKDSTTNAQSLAATAQQVNDPNTQSYVALCAKNTSCKDDADKVGTLIQQAITEIQAKQDSTQALTNFETALTTLIQCVDAHPPTDGTKPAAPAAPAQDINKTCTSQSDPNGTTVTVCTSTDQHCTAKELPNGDLVETCVSTNPNGKPTPTTDPNMPAVTNPNSIQPANPNTPSAVNPANPNDSAPATDPNTPKGSGTSEQCTASVLPDGSMSVTCTCNVKSGTCTVQTQSP